MASSIGQYTLVFLPREPSSLNWEAWQATVYKVAKSQARPERPCARRHKTFFCLWQLRPGQSWAWRWRSCLACGKTLASPSCRDTGCPHCRSDGPIRVFFWAPCSWQFEGLFGIFLHSSAGSGTLRAHLPGVFFCCSERQAHRGRTLAGVLLCRLAH